MALFPWDMHMETRYCDVKRQAGVVHDDHMLFYWERYFSRTTQLKLGLQLENVMNYSQEKDSSCKRRKV